MASNFLSEPITDIINTAIDTNTFLDRAKRASVTPIDKSGNDKHIYTNCEPLFINFGISLSQNVRHTIRTYNID